VQEPQHFIRICHDAYPGIERCVLYQSAFREIFKISETY
jgi:hypothetical protein